MSTQPWDVYAEELLTKGYGRPLWIPEPHKFTGGREIFKGDVGYIHEGHFIPFFNAMKLADDPINRSGVPRGFKSFCESQLNLSIDIVKYDIAIQSSYTTGNMKAEGTLSPHGQAYSVSRCPIAGWKLSCAAGRGAIMVIDSLAIVDQINSKLWIRECVRENMDSWLEFANARLKLCLDERDLVFISGTMKTLCWALGALAGKNLDLEKYTCEELGSKLTSSEDGDPRFAGPRFPVCHSGGGPAGASSEVCDQCLFIHYFKMKRRTSPEELGKRAWSLCRGKCEDEPAYRSHDEGRYDPIGPLLNYILQNPSTTTATVSDMDVTQLFNGKEFPYAKYLPRSIGWLSPLIKVNEHGVGTIDYDLNTLWAWRVVRHLVGRLQPGAHNRGV